MKHIMQVLINYITEESSVKKILFPTLEQIVDLKIQFDEGFDNLLLFDYQVGTIDINAYFSKIAFIKNNQLFVFTEYENPEHGSYETKLYNENNFKQCENKDVQDFFIQSRYYFYHSKFPETMKDKKIIYKKLKI